MISQEFDPCVKTGYVAMHPTVDPAAAPLNLAHSGAHCFTDETSPEAGRSLRGVNLKT